MGKFVIKNAKKGFNFVLKAGNGQVIATSEVYESEKACKAGLPPSPPRRAFRFWRGRACAFPFPRSAGRKAE